MIIDDDDLNALTKIIIANTYYIFLVYFIRNTFLFEMSKLDVNFNNILNNKNTTFSIPIRKKTLKAY